MGSRETSDLDVMERRGKTERKERMRNRYDVEQSLMSCWGIIDDIKLLSETVLDGKMNTDEVSNYLIGLHSVYGLKFQNCFDQFSELQKQQWKERAEIIKGKVK
jgi:hypothetical protein